MSGSIASFLSLSARIASKIDAVRLAVEVVRRAGARRPARPRSRPRRPASRRARTPRPRCSAAGSPRCGRCEALPPRRADAARRAVAGRGRHFASTTMVLTDAVTPGETSISTMCVPSSLIGSSSRTLRWSMRRPARLLDRVHDLLRGDGAEQPPVLTRAVGDRQHRLGQQRGGLLRALLLLARGRLGLLALAPGGRDRRRRWRPARACCGAR